MSATKTTGDLEGGTVAHVTFRARCETLGHGEDVFLVQEGDTGMQKMVPLYTSASSYPWYHALQPIALPLPPKDDGIDSLAIAAAAQSQQPPKPIESAKFCYRYVIHRAGVFYRWENVADFNSAPDDDEEGQDVTMADAAAKATTTPASGGTNAASSSATSSTTPSLGPHQLPLRLFAHRESYVVNDVLGKISGPPDIEHIRLPRQAERSSASTLHSREASRDNMSSYNSYGSLPSNKGSAGALTSVGKGGPGSSGNFHHHQSRKQKHVGFAPSPPPYHRPTNRPPPAANQGVHLNWTDGLIVVSAFLPVILHRSDAGQWTAAWDYEMLLSMQTHLRVTRVGVVKWRGWHGNSGKDGSPEAGVPLNERSRVEECLRPFNCVPVWIDTSIFGEMYNGFCKSVLWPVFHNVTSVYSSKPETEKGDGNDKEESEEGQFSEYCMDDVEQGPIHGGRGREAQLWASYNTVNRKFAEVVVQCFNEGDLVWIHGFHLLILPSYLTRRIPMAKVGIFLHTPFPSSEIFRTLWCREDLLRGMLNADQVGFHLFEYARHFLTCCRRLLGLNYGMIPEGSGGHTLAIDTNGRHVAITSIHAGVEPPVLDQILGHRLTVEKATTIRNRFFGKTIFCAIDRLESLKGIPLKLLGLERFLRRCPEWVGKLVLIQVGISAFERGEDYVKTKEEVAEITNKINKIWPGTVQFQECAESEMRLQQRMALLRASDVVLVTPIRDGLNLIPLEFTIAHKDALTVRGDGRKRGLCILSEFSSCTRVMRGALHVNPWKISEIANAFHQTLHMSEDERMRRISCASEFVTRVTTQRWALAVMLDLKGVHKNLNPMQYSGTGLGLGYRLLGMDIGFTSLDFNSVAKSFKNARSRLILLDYGGTIVSNDNLDNLARFQIVKDRKSHSLPNDSMIQALTDLCADKRNTVFVVSGKERHSLANTLGHIPKLGLAAEHGMFISWPTKSKEKRHWETLVPITDRTWRSLAITIMEVYTSRTHGSYIEETEMKVLWQYRDADLEFGYLQARELEDHLSKYLRSFPVDILHGGMEEGGYVEVRPKGVNKGVLAMKVIKSFPRIAQSDRVDFALVLGDDHCDEPMLSVMRQIGRRVKESKRSRQGEDPLQELPTTITLVDVSACDENLSSDLEVFTCTVGKKPSAAANYVHDVNEVQELMEALIRVSTRDPNYFSSADLMAYAAERAAEQSAPSNNPLLPPGIAAGLNAGSGLVPGLSNKGSGGLSKSMSLDQLIPGAETFEAEPTVSTNLQTYLKGIDDGDNSDDEAFFF